MKTNEAKVGLMLLNYCEAISLSKNKSLASAGHKWKDHISNQVADGPGTPDGTFSGSSPSQGFSPSTL